MRVPPLTILFVCLADEGADEPVVRNAEFLAKKITGTSAAEVFRFPNANDDYDHSWAVADSAYDDRKRFSCIVIAKSISDHAIGLIYAACQLQAEKTRNQPPLPIFRCLENWDKPGLVVPQTTTMPVTFEHAEMAKSA